MSAKSQACEWLHGTGQLCGRPVTAEDGLGVRYCREHAEIMAAIQPVLSIVCRQCGGRCRRGNGLCEVCIVRGQGGLGS